MSRLFITFLLLMACPTGSQAEALSREKIDGWLQHLGASDKFDASKGIDWGVMPGPFYTPELGLGIGTAVVGLYRPDPQVASVTDARATPSRLAVWLPTASKTPLHLLSTEHLLGAFIVSTGDSQYRPLIIGGRSLFAAMGPARQKKYTDCLSLLTGSCSAARKSTAGCSISAPAISSIDS